MDKKNVIELIKLDVLNNLDARDSESIQNLKRNDDDFPWKELGDYQNLVALLAVTSKIEEPDPKLKDNILARLYSFKAAGAVDEVFETAEAKDFDSSSSNEDTTYRFKVEPTSGEFDQGPVVEIEEFEIGTSIKAEEDIQNISEVNELNPDNDSTNNTAENIQPQENIYEIEEYDLEMSNDEVAEVKDENPPAIDPSLEEPEIFQENIYEIDEYDLDVTDNITPEPIIVNTPQVAVQENSEPGTEIVPQPENAIIDAGDTLLNKDDDIVIYNESEAVEQLSTEILSAVTESTKEIVSESEKSGVTPPPAPDITKSVSENNRQSKSDRTRESILFLEPNLSQLHSLFKDNHEITPKEKESRIEYRAKISKEHAEKTSKQQDSGSITEDVTVEIKPIDESKKNELEKSPLKEPTSRNEKPDKEFSIEKIKSPVKLKKEFGSGNYKKVALIAATICIICASVLFFMKPSNDIKEERTKIVKNEQKQAAYESIVEDKKPESVLTSEDIVPASQKNITSNQLENKPPPPPKPPQLIEPEVNTNNQNFPAEKNEIKENVKIETSLSPPKQEKKVEEEPGYFVAVEEMPAPIGGLKEIQSRIVYPKVAELAGVEGKVLVLAYVNESGAVTKVELVKGIGAGCDEVALNAVKQTNFKPGVQRGKPVKVRITIPIVFKKN